MRICPACTRENDDDASACEICDEPLEAAAAPAGAAPPATDGKFSGSSSSRTLDARTMSRAASVASSCGSDEEDHRDMGSR